MRKIYRALIQANIEGSEKLSIKKEILIPIVKILILILLLLKAFNPNFESIEDSMIIAIKEFIMIFSI